MKEQLKKSKFIKKTYEIIGKFTSTISPKLNSHLTYYIKTGEKLNLNDPITFEEKLIWLKLNTYNNNPLVTKCIDKYLVREYLEEKNYSFLLNDLYAVWDNPEEIKWDELPNKFAMKCNHGAGYNIICADKRKSDYKKAENQLKKWLAEDYSKVNSQVNYKNIKKKIILEKYLEPEEGSLPLDYKIYCFNGKAKAILVMVDRDKETKGIFMTTDWEFISIPDKYEMFEIPEKPINLDLMLRAAEDLSAPFPFVRVDFYEHEEKVIFGELTFTPAGGTYASKTEIDGITMGEMLDISKQIAENKR